MLSDYVNLHKQDIRKRLIEFLDEKKSQDLKIPLYENALARLSEFSTQGKMIRGVLAMMSAEMFGKDPKDLLDVSVAIELVHSGLLIHDDIIDDDVLRRGNKTIFAQYQDDQGSTPIESGSKFYGQSMAICVGDTAFFLAFELIANANLSTDATKKISSYFSAELQKVGAAEMEDFHFGATEDEPSIEQILNMYKLKSARYTFSLPLTLGAYVANKDKDVISKLEQFGENLGIVFQIVDDYLGITGDSQITGKPVGNDIKQNKKTVFRKMLYDKANSEQKEILDSIFGKSEVSKDDVDKIIKLADELKVQQEIDSLVSKLSKTARQILNNIDIPAKYKELLEELIEYNLRRNK